MQHRSNALAEVYFFLQGNPFDHINGPEHHHNFYQLVRHAGPRSGGPSFGHLSDSYSDGDHPMFITEAEKLEVEKLEVEKLGRPVYRVMNKAGRIFCGALNVITGAKECPKIGTYMMSMFYVHVNAIFKVPLAWFQRSKSLLVFEGGSQCVCTVSTRRQKERK